MMLKQLSLSNRFDKQTGLKIKSGIRLAILLTLFFWLLYHFKHSGDGGNTDVWLEESQSYHSVKYETEKLFTPWVFVDEEEEEENARKASAEMNGEPFEERKGMPLMVGDYLLDCHDMDLFPMKPLSLEEEREIRARNTRPTKSNTRPPRSDTGTGSRYLRGRLKSHTKLMIS